MGGFGQIGVVVATGAHAHIQQSGPVAHNAVDPALDVLSEDLFFQKTRIRASWPERVALARLFRENIRHGEVRAIWGRELTFDGSAFRLHLSKWVAWSVVGMIVLTVGLGLWMITLPTDVASTSKLALKLTAGVVNVLWAFVATWWGAKYLKPRWFAKKIQPVLPRVNAELPVIFAGYMDRMIADVEFKDNWNGGSRGLWDD